MILSTAGIRLTCHDHNCIVLKNEKGGIMAKLSLQKKYWVTKQNDFNAMQKINMTLQEMRLLCVYLSRINKSDLNTRWVRFHISELQTLLEVGNTFSFQYYEEVARNLLNKIVEVKLEGRGFDMFTLFSVVKMRIDENNEWYMELNANDESLPLMFDYQNKFFSYQLWNTLRLKSTNQIRMYEILKQYEKIGHKIFSIEELKVLIGIHDNEYPKYKHFRQDVLEVCKDALTALTDISFTYESHGKKGPRGKILKLKFNIIKNKDYKDPVGLTELIENGAGAIIKGEYSEVSGRREIDFDDLDENGLVRSTGNSPIYEERIAYLMLACDSEFSREQIIVLYAIMAKKKNHHNINEDSCYQYLILKYSELEERCQNPNLNPVKNRFNYIKKMIQDDDI